MKGVQFVVDDDGKQQAVLIDLRTHRRLWEDFYDAAMAQSRKDEPRETLEQVKQRVSGDKS
jgi:hypothetical protein